MNKGALCAYIAALLNAFVGVFSLGAFNLGITPTSVAFYKCLIALITLSFWILTNQTLLTACIRLSKHKLQIALISFCGIFLLYFFETNAYSSANISTVVFTLLGTSTITTFLASAILLKKPLSPNEGISLLLALIGLFLFSFNNKGQFQLNVGLIFAMIAGLGYGLFLTLNQKKPASFHGVPMLWWLLLFGTLYLSIPFAFSFSALPNLHATLYIVLLSWISTIGGFYFTTKALSLTKATIVQLVELNEPLFATILGLVIYHQKVTHMELFGGFLILAAIYTSYKPFYKSSTSRLS
jgi:DME family drug/metabolite transporter